MGNKSFLIRSGAILIIFCILALVVTFMFSIFFRVKNIPENVSVQFVLPVDSTGTLTPEALKIVNDLKEDLEIHEHVLEAKYNHILEQKESMNDFISIGGLFLAVIIGLFGFFGYKSMSGLEEKVEKEAKFTAEKTVEEIAKKQFDNYKTTTRNSLKAELDTEVNEKIRKRFAQDKQSTKIHIEAIINKKIQESIQKVNDQEETINNLDESISNLDLKVSRINERITTLESSNILPTAGRRTLINGGKKS